MTVWRKYCGITPAAATCARKYRISWQLLAQLFHPEAPWLEFDQRAAALVELLRWRSHSPTAPVADESYQFGWGPLATPVTRIGLMHAWTVAG